MIYTLYLGDKINKIKSEGNYNNESKKKENEGKQVKQYVG